MSGDTAVRVWAELSLLGKELAVVTFLIGIVARSCIVSSNARR